MRHSGKHWADRGTDSPQGILRLARPQTSQRHRRLIVRGAPASRPQQAARGRDPPPSTLHTFTSRDGAPGGCSSKISGSTELQLRTHPVGRAGGLSQLSARTPLRGRAPPWLLGAPTLGFSAPERPAWAARPIEPGAAALLMRPWPAWHGAAVRLLFLASCVGASVSGARQEPGGE